MGSNGYGNGSSMNSKSNSVSKRTDLSEGSHNRTDTSEQTATAGLGRRLTQQVQDGKPLTAAQKRNLKIKKAKHDWKRKELEKAEQEK